MAARVPLEPRVGGDWPPPPRTQRAASPPPAHRRDVLRRGSVSVRLAADFLGTGVTLGKHPMAYRRAELHERGALPATRLGEIPDGQRVRIAGSVIVRQRPGTANGFVFLSLEDETGIANVIVTPRLFDENRRALVEEPFLLIEGVLQNQENVVSVKARSVEALPYGVDVASHDFH